MKLGQYKRLKSLLNGPGMQGCHSYTFIGKSADKPTNQGTIRRYSIQLIPQDGAIYMINDLMRLVDKISPDASCFIHFQGKGCIDFL